MLTMLGQTALMLIRQALRSIPLVADDPKETCGVVPISCIQLQSYYVMIVYDCHVVYQILHRDLSAPFVYTLSY